MITVIITLSGLLFVAILVILIQHRLFRKSLQSQDYYYKLFRREQKEVLSLEKEKRILEQELFNRTKIVSDLKSELERGLNDIISDVEGEKK